MAKTRLQLAAIASVLGYLGYLLLVNVLNNAGKFPLWKEFLMYLDITFLTTALGILGCTFVRVKQLSDGSVCFMPNHPLVRLGLVSKRKTSLCPTFWMVGGVITLVGLATLILLGFLAVAIMQTINGKFVEEVGLPSLMMAIFIGILSLFCWLATKGSWLLKIPLVLSITLGAVVFLYLWPMAKIGKSYGLTFRDSQDWVAGTIIYLRWLSVIVVLVASAATLTYLAFKHWGVLTNNWLGKQIKSLKEKLCVRFVECS